MYPRTIVQRLTLRWTWGESQSVPFFKNASIITRDTSKREQIEAADQSLTMRGVFGQFDASLIQNLVKCRPTASAIVLRVRGEQFLIAHDAGVRPLFVELVVATGKRPAPNKACEWVRGGWTGEGLRVERWKREGINRDTYNLFLNLLAVRLARIHKARCSWKSYFGVSRLRLNAREHDFAFLSLIHDDRGKLCHDATLSCENMHER